MSEFPGLIARRVLGQNHLTRTLEAIDEPSNDVFPVGGTAPRTSA